MTKDKIKEMVEMYLKGITVEALAIQFNTSKAAVYYFLRREGVGQMKKEKIQRTFGDMGSVTDTARQLGVSRSTVYRQLNRGSIYSQYAKLLKDKGHSVEYIANELKVSQKEAEGFLCSEC